MWREKMGKLIAACGTDCTECEAYKATHVNDSAAIERIAKEWSKNYNISIEPSNVWCDGCMTESPRKCAHCPECDVRLCAIERNISTCAHCLDYPCNNLKKYFEQAPDLRANLEEIRANL